MIFFVVAIISLAIGIIYIVRRDKLRQENMLIKLKEDWGKPKSEQYNQEKMDSIKSNYDYSVCHKITEIDDITWNDFQMNQLYHQINHTESSMGETNLYRILRNPIYDDEILKERDRVIEFFQANEKTRIKYQSKFRRIGKLQNISFYDYIEKSKKIDFYSVIPHIAIVTLLLLSVLLIFFYPKVGGILTAIVLAIDIYLYYRTKLKIDGYIPVLTHIGKMLEVIKILGNNKEKELKCYIQAMSRTEGIYKKYKKNISYITLGISGGISEIDTLLDYIRIVTHIDLIIYVVLMKSVKKNADILIEAYEALGFLDSMIAIASYRQELEFYCKPEVKDDSDISMSMKDIYHPLIENPISSSIEMNKSVLITGSNASGKSAFLKSLGMNAILAQTIYTVLAKEYKSNYFKVMSSMTLQDDLQNHDSYYLVEIKSLKRILDANNDQVPILCFIDEVLRGTNTIERIAASSTILENLSQMNVLCVAATHDIELTYILDKYYKNYHFQEVINEENIIFDYKLYTGRSVTRNAIRLLKLIGYSEDIVQEARNRAENFIEYGSWNLKENNKLY